MEHLWVAAANVQLEPAAAKRAARTHEVTLDAGTTVDVVDVLCARCRRSYGDAAGSPCERTPVLYGGPVQRKPPTRRTDNGT